MVHILGFCISLDISMRFYPLSFQCHYSIKAACATLGIGLDNCVGVPCDHR